MSFSDLKPFDDNFDLFLVFGDSFEFALLFDFNITDYGFEYYASATLGGEKIIDLDESDMTIVSGDPDSTANSVTVSIDADTTIDYSFDCLYHRFRYVDTLGKSKTVFSGNLRGVA